MLETGTERTGEDGRQEMTGHDLYLSIDQFIYPFIFSVLLPFPIRASLFQLSTPTSNSTLLQVRSFPLVYLSICLALALWSRFDVRSVGRSVGISDFLLVWRTLESYLSIYPSIAD